jgi:hypothetical protein
MALKTFPLIKNFRATTYSKAFVLNAIATAAIAAFAIEMRLALDDKYSKAYGYFNNLIMKEDLTQLDKMFIVFGTAYLGALFVYHLMFMFFGFGGGLIAPSLPSAKYY